MHGLFFLSTKQHFVFAVVSSEELSLHAIADRVSAARLSPLLPAPPGHDTHHRARIRRHHRRARLAHALSRPGCRIQAANAFMARCGENERSRTLVAIGRGMFSMFATFAHMHVRMAE